MNKPIRPQYLSDKKNRRVGLTHISKVIQRLMRIYGLEDELIEHQEDEAAAMQSAEFDDSVVIAPALPVAAGSQNTFSWYQEINRTPSLWEGR